MKGGAEGASGKKDEKRVQKGLMRPSPGVRNDGGTREGLRKRKFEVGRGRLKTKYSLTVPGD